MIARDTNRRLRWAEIDTAALEHNVAAVRATLRPDTSLMAMVKSDGYGHGALTAARAALAGGATWLGVYTPDEALALREAGITERLLVVGWSPPATIADLVAGDVDSTVFDVEGVRAASTAASSQRARSRLHVKVDSGLGRLGARLEAVPALVAALQAAGERVEVAGIFTHFADAEGDPQFTRDQHDRFLRAVALLRPVAPRALLHACGSAAIVTFPGMHHDIVRLGIAMYGYLPRGLAADVSLRPAMTVLARVVQVKTIEAGESVGYGRTWWAPSQRRIATVAIGYGQGFPRVLSNRGHLDINGHRCPLAGIVSMDQVSVDVTDAGTVTAGDEALVFGERGGDRLGADEVAALAETIPYELICSSGAALPRVVVDAVNDVPSTAVP